MLPDVAAEPQVIEHDGLALGHESEEPTAEVEAEVDTLDGFFQLSVECPASNAST
jgi:hypothetical protein